MKRLRSRKRLEYNIEKDVEPMSYLFNVNSYDKPPICNKSLLDLEEICIDRLKLYRVLTEANNLHEIYTKGWCEVVVSRLKENQLISFLTLLSIFENNEVISRKVNLTRIAREVDHIGHYVLSLVFCNNAQSILCFLDYELQWFRFRFSTLSDINRHGFLIDSRINYEVVSCPEKNQFKQQLFQCLDVCRETFCESVFYKLRFDEVYKLVKMKKAFLHKGFAYFLEQDVIFAVTCKLKEIWLERLHVYNDEIDELRDSRIKMFVKNLLPECLRHCQKSYKGEFHNTLNIESIDDHAKQYFPLCMQHLHDSLKKNSHLRHFSRKQYATFLKHAGMPYEDAINFFKTEFTKIINDTDFVKLKYDYYFRHVYGEVGGRIYYNCDSCHHLFEEGPTLNDDNGCPFSGFDDLHLHKKLQENCLKMTDIEDIMFYKKRGRYKEACMKYFSTTQKEANQISYLGGPNQYYHLAVKTHNERMSLLNNCYVNDYFEDSD